MTEGNEIYRKNERVNDSEYNFLNILNKNMNPYLVERTIPRAGAASGLNRPSGCVGYFIRDDSFIQYRKILHSAVASCNIDRYSSGILSLEAAPLVTKYR